ncbi:ATP-binding protein [Mucilaginibacter calamicampi]|uniref:histidine kinase n=1 Tax=Mucilaginibacter calamicampi TaxID=1302352 RepID=A0ABW2YY94_9SPHI
MGLVEYTFDNEQLNRLFPYYILINKDFSIEGLGKALVKIIGSEPGLYFYNVFKIVDHGSANALQSSLTELGGFNMKISVITAPDTILQGNLEYIKHSGKYLFTGNTVAGNPGLNADDTIVNANKTSGDRPFDEHFFERVLNELPSDVVVLDTNHTYRFINPGAIKDPELRKWTIGKTDEEYCAYRNRPQSLATVRRQNFNEVMRTKQQRTWEELITTPDGSVRTIVRNMCPVLDGQNNIDFIIGYGLDITDRKKIEEQVKVSEKRYRDLYDFSPALIYTHDLDGTMLSVNPAISAVLGYSNDEVVNKNLKILLPPTDQDKIQTEYLQKVISSGISKGIFRAGHKNGTTKYLFYQNYKVEEQDSAPYVIGFAQDITERILAEKELLLAKRNTEKLAKVKDTFLANMSHELRTPMNGILGVTNLLTKTTLNDQQTHYAHLISDSVNNLLTIVNDILDMEKISSGKIEFEHHAFKVVDKVKSLVHSFQRNAEQKKLELLLSNTLPANLVVNGDQHRLAQILNNLLSNAIKFTNKGKIKITLSLLHYTETDVIIEFVVEDTGIGIPESRLSTIFDPFVVGPSNITKFGGTGLGLSISKNLVEMQGGSMELSSKVSTGSTFTFSLPFKRGQLQEVSEMKTQNLNLSKINKKILVAEDIELNQFLVKTMLESWGISVDIAVNGKVAVDKVKENSYDLILMDIQMPEMDGMTATRHIRELPDTEKAQIPIIAFTANTLQGDAKLYRDAGMNDYVTKPYAEEKLHEKIKEVLNLAAQPLEPVKTGAIDEASSNVAEPEERLYNISMIESIGKSNPAFIEKMIVMFVDFVSKDFEKLKDAASKNNWAEVGQIAHKLKSTFGNMGVNTLVPFVFDLETQTGDPNALIKALDAGLEKVFSQLRQDYPDLFTT